MSGDRTKGHLDLLLMTTLAKSDGHGYAIITELRDRSGGEFDLPEGTIYPALHRLEEHGLVSSSWSVADRRRRRIYALTAQGRTACEAQRVEWEGFQRGVTAVLAWAT